MPIEMHPVAARRIFRLVFVTAFALWLSQAVNWSASFITPVLLSMLLAIPLPGLKLKQGLIFVLALVIPLWFTTWFLLPVLTHQPMVGMLLLIAACFWAFYYSASGGSPILGAFLTMGLAIVAAVGSDSIDSVIAVDKALTFNAIVAIVLMWLAYVIVPEKPVDAGPKARPQAEKPSRDEAIRSAWRSTAIVLPVIVFFLLYAGSSSYLVVMIKVASMGQQAENDKTKEVGKSLLMSTFIGGVGAVVIWNLMSIWPSLINLVLLVVLAGFFMGRRIFQGQGMAAGAGTWSYAFLTMLVIIVPALLDGPGGDAAGVKFYDRISMLAWATLYGVAAVYVFDAFWRKKVPQAAAD
ncbi:MAG: DUF2955 domain-containing protein [Xanthomonadales bacterium]|nr:DUF2955 domain-containing protein [Xanthomonadales bacterium]